MPRQRLYRAENSIEARLLAGLLEQQRIEVDIRGESLTGAVGELPADLLQIELWVDETSFNQAQQIMQQWQQQKNVTGHWHCQQCNESNPASFDICWQCGSPALRSQ
ncbi:DUF2007 domain-containing protein [Neiella marina]|uniref:DUF2007 domain-containing protein n=1 Tax=Neiella holothuriorum TaxID=2870530 RepID=A0ABS7EFL7_9GAMM|nr:DUF2007 domain-containing protein [Neiella holothuriorum]MBW8191147.1 DUF2007 domain-containing protein [Neiella holothuriorum]